MYGRATVFNITNVLFVAFTLGCGFSNTMTTLIILRFFSGFCGSACLALGGGVIADMIQPDARGKATAIWSIGPLMGPVRFPTRSSTFPSAHPFTPPFLRYTDCEGHWPYLRRIHVSENRLALDLLRNHHRRRPRRPRHLHLPTRNQPRPHPRTQSPQTAPRNRQPKPKIRPRNLHLRPPSPHPLPETSLQTPLHLAYRSLPFRPNGHQLRLPVPLFHHFSNCVSGGLWVLGGDFGIGVFGIGDWVDGRVGDYWQV